MILKTLQVKRLLMCYSERRVCSMYILGLTGKQNEYLMAFHVAEYAGEHNYITAEHFARERECKLCWHVSTWRFIFVHVQPETNPPNTHPHMLTHTQPCRSEHTCVQALKHTHTHRPNKRVCLYKQTDSGFIKVLTNPSLKTWSTLFVLFTGIR